MGMSVNRGNRHAGRDPPNRVVELVPAISPPPYKVWWESRVEGGARDQSRAWYHMCQQQLRCTAPHSSCRMLLAFMSSRTSFAHLAFLAWESVSYGHRTDLLRWHQIRWWRYRSEISPKLNLFRSSDQTTRTPTHWSPAECKLNPCWVAPHPLRPCIFVLNPPAVTPRASPLPALLPPAPSVATRFLSPTAVGCCRLGSGESELGSQRSRGGRPRHAGVKVHEKRSGCACRRRRG